MADRQARLARGRRFFEVALETTRHSAPSSSVAARRAAPYDFLQHNAFRSPGAASTDDLRAKQTKVEYYKDRYSAMRRQIHAHAMYVDESNVGDLAEMDFVFVAVDDGKARRLIVEVLQAAAVPFVDVGVGVYAADDALGGQIRVTTGTPDKRNHLPGRIPFAAADDPANEYRNNVQIADLNMLNAALAVIKWKKLCGFYVDLDREHHSVYEIDGNFIHNEDATYDDGTPDPQQAGATGGLTAVNGESTGDGAEPEGGDETTRVAA